MISLINKVNFNTFDFLSIQMSFQVGMLSSALQMVVFNSSIDSNTEKLIDSFFEVPEHPSEDYIKFFDGLSDILFLDAENNRYEFLNDAVKVAITEKVMEYYSWLDAKYGD